MRYWNIILRICFVSNLIYSFTINNANSQNLVKNSGFETGDISLPWNIWTGSVNSSVSADTINFNSGSFCAKLCGQEVYLNQPVILEPYTTYKVFTSLKSELSDTVYFGVSNIWDSIGVSIVFNDTIFRSDSLYFTTDGNPGDNIRIYFWKGEGTGSVWVDDVKLIADTSVNIFDEPGGLGTYYVSPFGDDTNTGTSPEEAWQTTDKVNKIDFEPGDQILFEGGEIFNGTIRFNYNDNGIAGNHVLLGSYGTGRATIDGQVGSGFIASDCNYIKVKNLNFLGDGRKTGNKGNGLVFNFCSDVIADSVEVSGFQHSGIKVNYIGSNYSFTNIYTHDNGYSGIYVSGLNKTSLSNIYIGYCIADNNPGDPTVTDNHSGNGIFAYNASNITIEFCEASNNGWDMPRTGNGPGGIWVAEVDSAIIQHCISHDNKTSVGGLDGLGFDLDGGITNSIIQYCLSYNNQGAGYGIFQYSGATDWKNNIIRYCVSENDGNVSAGGSLAIWNGTGNKNKFQGFEFYNNVVYNTGGATLSFLDHYNLNFNFRNNIFVSKKQSVYNGIDGESFQGNCWYSLNGEFYLDSVIDFEKWARDNNQEMLNGEIVGMFADPKLVNPGSSTLTEPVMLPDIDDYKIQDSSKVIDSGLDLKLLFDIDPGVQDYFGNAIKQGLAFDIGINEYIEPFHKREVSFIPGWNIFSLPSNPDTTDMKTIFHPVIDRGSLVKIQDELGNSLENWGVFGGWQNNIGEVAPSEGYKIKLNVEDSLEVFGVPVKFPFAIPLRAGWNIAGYPQETNYNGMDVVQQLIDEGVLEKVQDESGNSIEDWGIFGSWQNNIGDFKPGKGYKIKVIANDTLWIYDSYPKSSSILPELVATKHFQPEFDGNGVDHMNINLVGLPVNVLKAGDELAIFDGKTCVGAVTIMPQHLQNQKISIVVSASDNQGMAGFGEGNPITLKLWNSRSIQEFNLEPEILKGTLTFTRDGTSIASLEKYATMGIKGIVTSGLPEIKCYPNPFSEEITVEIRLEKDAKVEAEVLNQLGQQVKTIATKKILKNGLHRMRWNGENNGGKRVSSGIYYLKITVGSEIYFEKLIFNSL